VAEEEWQVSLPQPLFPLAFLLLRDEKDVDIMTTEYTQWQKYYSWNTFSSITSTSPEPYFTIWMSRLIFECNVHYVLLG